MRICATESALSLFTQSAWTLPKRPSRSDQANIEKAMGNYRLYSVDVTGKIVGLELLHAETDDDAVNLARALNKGRTCEVWNRTKLVQTIAGADAPGQPSNA